MAPSTRAAAAAAISTNMKNDDKDKQKQAKKKKRKELMDTLVAKKKVRTEEARKQFFSSPKERIQWEGPTSLSKPCKAAIVHCIKEGVEVPDCLKSNPRAQMPDPRSLPPPMVAPMEDDSLLIKWPADNEHDPERATDTTDFWFFDNVKVMKPTPGEENQLGWYCASRQEHPTRLPDSANKKKSKPKKKTVVMAINIKKPHDD